MNELMLLDRGKVRTENSHRPFDSVVCFLLVCLPPLISSRMFSTPTPASGSRAIASRALRRAGLMDADTQMRDGDRDRKNTARSRRRIRGTESAKEQAIGSTQRSVNITTHSFL